MSHFIDAMVRARRLAHEKPNARNHSTFELLAELERRHKSFVFAAVDTDGEVVFDCNGDPAELYGLGQIAIDKAYDEADDLLSVDDDLDDEEPEDGNDETSDDDVEGRDLPPPAPEPVKAPPVVVKIEARFGVPADVTHVVLSPCEKLGDPIPGLVDVEGWRPAFGGPGETWGHNSPSLYRRGHGVIELTPENRGYGVPEAVTHLVEVPCKVGDTAPEFFMYPNGVWNKSPSNGKAVQSWQRENRRARRALPEETPAPAFISRIAEPTPGDGSDFVFEPVTIAITLENRGYNFPTDVKAIKVVEKVDCGDLLPEFTEVDGKWFSRVQVLGERLSQSNRSALRRANRVIVKPLTSSNLPRLTHEPTIFGLRSYRLV